MTIIMITCLTNCFLSSPRQMPHHPDGLRAHQKPAKPGQRLRLTIKNRHRLLKFIISSLLAGTSVTPPAGMWIFLSHLSDPHYFFSSTVAMTLVNGVPNNHSRRFNTLDDAILAYALAVRQSNVRRVRPVIQPSGHVYVCSGS